MQKKLCEHSLTPVLSRAFRVQRMGLRVLRGGGPPAFLPSQNTVVAGAAEESASSSLPLSPHLWTDVHTGGRSAECSW